jgi:hypothetical protein
MLCAFPFHLKVLFLYATTMIHPNIPFMQIIIGASDDFGQVGLPSSREFFADKDAKNRCTLGVNFRIVTYQTFRTAHLLSRCTPLAWFEASQVLIDGLCAEIGLVTVTNRDRTNLLFVHNHRRCCNGSKQAVAQLSRRLLTR